MKKKKDPTYTSGFEILDPNTGIGKKAANKQFKYDWGTASIEFVSFELGIIHIYSYG